MATANAITISGSMSAALPDLPQPVGFSFTNAQYDNNTPTQIGGTVLVGFASSEALPLGPVTQPGWAQFYNNDTVNSVQIWQSSSTSMVTPAFTLPPGGWAIVPLDANCVPYAQAIVAAVSLTYLIISQ